MDSPAQLARRLAEVLTPSSAIVCIGNELRGDDGAGVVIARKLPASLPWKVFDTQTAPESFLGKIVAVRPASVLLIDAVDLAAPAGTVRLVPAENITGQGPSTHGPAPQAFLEMLKQLHPCPRWLLGIQPQGLETGSGLSPPVAAAVGLIVQALRLAAQRA